MEIKRGDTIALTNDKPLIRFALEPPADMQGWHIAAVMTQPDGMAVTALVGEWVDASVAIQRFVIRGTTAGWPLGHLNLELRVTSPTGEVSHSRPQIVLVRR